MKTVCTAGLLCTPVSAICERRIKIEQLVQPVHKDEKLEENNALKYSFI